MAVQKTNEALLEEIKELKKIAKGKNKQITNLKDKKKELEDKNKELEDSKDEEPKEGSDPVEETTSNMVYVPLDENGMFFIQSRVDKINLRLDKGQVVTLVDIGDRRPLRLSDIRTIVTKNRNALRKGQFIIEDQKVIEELKLENVCRHVSIKNVEDFIGKDISTFMEEYKTLDVASRVNIRDTLIKKTISGETIDFNQANIVDKHYRGESPYRLSIQDEANVFLSRKK